MRMSHPSLSPDQVARIHAWAAEGVSLSEIQSRLNREFGLGLTYMDTRFLLADLQTDLAAWRPAEPEATPAATDDPATPVGELESESFPPALADAPADTPPGGGVRVSIDQITRPGALVSGSVVFSDGKTASWLLDETGRLGLSGTEPGYRPSRADVIQFEQELQAAITRAGI
jgi:hypothetical protein